MCPGNNESAGKGLGGTTEGNLWPRKTERSWRGGHQIRTTVDSIIKHKITYHDLGEDFYHRQRADHLKLGFNAEVAEMRPAA